MLRDKTVILGGSFNPPHAGHQMSCLYHLENLGAKEVWLVPVDSHPLGKSLLDFEYRMEMCRLLALPFHGNVLVSNAERELSGEGRTYDLLKFLKGSHPDKSFALSVGADILQQTQLWHRWDDIPNLAQVVVLARRGYPSVGPGGSVDAGLLALPEVSSSDIRHRLSIGAEVTGLLPTSVHTYIEAEGLYGLKLQSE